MFTTVKNDEQYENYSQLLWFLVSEADMNNPVVGELIELLIVLTQDYDERHNIGQPLDPVQLIRSFMDEHDIMNGNELAEEIDFDNKYHVVEFLRYKREPSEELVTKLSDRFKIQKSALTKDYRLDGQTSFHRGS